MNGAKDHKGSEGKEIRSDGSKTTQTVAVPRKWPSLAA